MLAMLQDVTRYKRWHKYAGRGQAFQSQPSAALLPLILTWIAGILYAERRLHGANERVGREYCRLIGCLDSNHLITNQLDLCSSKAVVPALDLCRQPALQDYRLNNNDELKWAGGSQLRVSINAH